MEDLINRAYESISTHLKSNRDIYLQSYKNHPASFEGMTQHDIEQQLVEMLWD